MVFIRQIDNQSQQQEPGKHNQGTRLRHKQGDKQGKSEIKSCFPELGFHMEQNWNKRQYRLGHARQ